MMYHTTMTNKPVLCRLNSFYHHKRYQHLCYLRYRLASGEGIVLLGVCLSHCHVVCVSAEPRWHTARVSSCCCCQFSFQNPQRWPIKCKPSKVSIAKKTKQCQYLTHYSDNSSVITGNQTSSCEYISGAQNFFSHGPHKPPRVRSVPSLSFTSAECCFH